MNEMSLGVINLKTRCFTNTWVSVSLSTLVSALPSLYFLRANLTFLLRSLNFRSPENQSRKISTLSEAYWAAYKFVCSTKNSSVRSKLKYSPVPVLFGSWTCKPLRAVKRGILGPRSFDVYWICNRASCCCLFLLTPRLVALFPRAASRPWPRPLVFTCRYSSLIDCCLSFSINSSLSDDS